MTRDDRAGRAATPVVGNILLVAVVLIIAVALVTLSFAFLERTGTPTADASFEYEQTAAGLEVIPKALGTDVTVQLNGKDIATIDANSSGQSVLVPTAPGDTLTIVSRDEDRSVLINKQIDDRSEVGDFIAYYTFESESGSTLEDRSGNGNDGTLSGDGDRWTGNSYDFGGDDNFNVTGIDSSVEVSEFTIAVTYKPDDTGSMSKQELIEHKSGEDNWVLELKPCDNSEVGNFCDGDNAYTPVFSVDNASGSQDGQIFAERLEPSQRHVVIGTFDGSEHSVYVDGDLKNETNFYDGEISMGDATIGKDFEGESDRFDGDIYEVRLYYRAFDQQEIEVLTEAMS